VKTWCIPPRANAEFVYHMEDVLRIYQLPYDPRYPVVCLDEASKQLLGEVHPALPLRAGGAKCEDYEYERKGVCNQFMCCEPLRGWRHVRVTARRTKRDWAACIRELVDVHYPQATLIRVVLDNLNTHTGAALYEAFPPEEARRLLNRLEFHHTPKHASWLNMAEIEIGVLNRQCLDRRLDNVDWLRREVAAWEAQRNQHQVKIHWSFTITIARNKLQKLYPVIENSEPPM
jgi:DDE superfamily endonuclease